MKGGHLNKGYFEGDCKCNTKLELFGRETKVHFKVKLKYSETTIRRVEKHTTFFFRYVYYFQ